VTEVLARVTVPCLPRLYIWKAWPAQRDLGDIDVHSVSRSETVSSIILLATPFSEVHHLAYPGPAVSLVGLFAVAHSDQVTAGGLVVCGVLLWGGRLDRSGPFFFLAIILLLGLVAAVVHGWREPVLSPGERRRENGRVDHDDRSRPDAIGAPPEGGP
jgi:hypothetical protein